MFQKNEYDAAIYHFKKLLDAKPENYVALHKLICLLQRAGKLESVSNVKCHFSTIVMIVMHLFDDMCHNIMH